MNTATVGLPVPGTSLRTMQKAVALMVAALMLLSTGARVTIPSLHLGRLVSVVVSKLDPRDTTPERSIQRMGGKVGKPLHIVDGFEAKVPEGGLGSLATTPNVRGMARNNTVHFHGQYGENSGVASATYTDANRASKVWGTGITGSGVNVAVIDTGVDQSGDLAGRVVQAMDFSGENAPNADNFGHGTFVAGLIAGTGAGSNGAVKGMAPGAGIVSIKIAGRDGTTNIFRLLAALEYVVTYKDALGIRVVNLSLGSDSKQSYLVDPLDFAVERVWNAGVVVVTASGNKGTAPGTIVKPADDPLVITVGALDDKTTVGRSDDSLASFSGAGPTQDGIAKPELIASGRSVVSVRAPGSYVDQSFPNAQIGTGYFKGSGTSFSSAIMAGAAALMIQKSWNLNPNQVKQRLINNARGISNVPASQQGAGATDVYNAVTSTDLAAANQGVTPARGTGSLNQSSGSACFRDTTTGNCLTDADVNAITGFNSSQYFGANWAGSQWTGSQWTGSQWTGSQWTGSQWTGSQWTGSQWTGSQWTGSQWTGSQWTAGQWAGSQWTGSQWTGSQWTGSQWTGSQWTGSQWTGSQWTGSQWTGSQWTGDQWTNLEWLGNHWT